MIAAALERCGLRTGLYTSPHLERLEERFVINGQSCSNDDLVRLVESVQPIVADLDRQQAGRGRRGPTFFEITTAIGLRYFADRSTEAVVLEVGLGGRLDSTNVCQPEICVITSISFDHMRQLGNTLAKIASEKAGIIKPGVPVVSGVLENEPGHVIASVARQFSAPLFQLGVDFHARYQRRAMQWNEQGEELVSHMDYWERVDGREISLTDVKVGLIGEHQTRNAAVAIATLLRLQNQGFRLSEQSIRAGLAAPQCPARIEVVSAQPPVIVDVAHNMASIAALVDVLNEQFPDRRRTIIFAASHDKNVSGMLQLVMPHCHHLILTRYCSNPRSVAPADLLAVAEQLRSTKSCAPTLMMADRPEDAWNAARAAVDPAELICITGSFFLAAEMRSIVCRDPRNYLTKRLSIAP
jgi:dihydrofolate synthase/folylpolyglutamate synthase